MSPSHEITSTRRRGHRWRRMPTIPLYGSSSQQRHSENIPLDADHPTQTATLPASTSEDTTVRQLEASMKRFEQQAGELKHEISMLTQTVDTGLKRFDQKLQEWVSKLQAVIERDAKSGQQDFYDPTLVGMEPSDFVLE
ncbi:hypothetical protein BKA67DRAFT_660108 [Truncatella angustata]|uniref:Uncharacterized protein n=1 Tax=Truncatella angustata TaxID=152316 RepID=A0A9P8UJK8_9PEZI|nr:uncharacterized protein BKA67DRAFT_660048 [Truncatella angustata]XP_045957782.1 uncharacterized protein BKA67DRAFT_660108 [Truncatella angustata]KAH6653425.1 hypothetical protein BKA67DRAFT_660048 [Truncatella angustata]KAH6653505.1 hypothetical protein BKA67DRAFT_660108 [Truncatella angustata]